MRSEVLDGAFYAEEVAIVNVSLNRQSFGLAAIRECCSIFALFIIIRTAFAANSNTRQMGDLTFGRVHTLF